MTGMQTPKQIVAERSEWANSLQVANREQMQEIVGPALTDQLDAAHQESEENLDLLASLLRGNPQRENPDSEQGHRNSAALIQYAFDRAIYICDHARQPRSPRPITALMAADVVACDQCRLPAVLKAGDRHPGACEFCGKATRAFFPSAFNCAHVTVLVDSCEACRDELRGLLEGT